MSDWSGSDRSSDAETASVNSIDDFDGTVHPRQSNCWRALSTSLPQYPETLMFHTIPVCTLSPPEIIVEYLKTDRLTKGWGFWEAPFCLSSFDDIMPRREPDLATELGMDFCAAAAEEKARALRLAGTFERYIHLILEQYPRAAEWDPEESEDTNLRKQDVFYTLCHCATSFDTITERVLVRLDDVPAFVKALEEELPKGGDVFKELYRLFHQVKDWLDFLENHLVDIGQGGYKGLFEAGIPLISMEDGSLTWGPPRPGFPGTRLLGSRTGGIMSGVFLELV